MAQRLPGTVNYLTLQAEEFREQWVSMMSDFHSGERPRASATTVANFIIMVAAVLTLGGGMIAGVISITLAMAEVRSDVRVLQQQMTDVRSDVREVAKAVRDRSKP